MLHCISEINKGKPYRKVASTKRKISIGTLWRKVKAVNKGLPVRPKQGPKTKLTAETEQQMSDYLEECWEFGMPKKKTEFQDEIVHYMECYQIANTFPNTKPGDGWFTRFHTEHKEVRYPTKQQLTTFATDSFTVSQWVAERDRYILEQEMSRFPCSTKGILVLECELLAVPEAKGLSFLTMIVYNADGELLPAIAIHDGVIQDSLRHHFSGKIGFIKTDDGKMNYDCLGGCLQHIQEHMMDMEVPLPYTAYMAPNVKEHLSIASWSFAKEMRFILIPIPNCIFSGNSAVNNSIFHKIQPSFEKLVKDKCLRQELKVTNALFLECLYQTVGHCKVRRHEDMDVEVGTDNHDEANEVIPESSTSQTAEERQGDSVDIQNNEEFFDETVHEMLENFEHEMHEDWLDSILHEFDN